MTLMTPNQESALIAILARIDSQIAESEMLLLKSPTGTGLRQITEELAYLRTQRRGIAAKLYEER